MPCHLRTFLVSLALLVTRAICAVNADQGAPYGTNQGGVSVAAREIGRPQSETGQAASAPQVPQDLRLKRLSTPTSKPHDVLPPFAVARLGAIRFAARTHVTRSAISPDGLLLASASDGTLPALDLWDAKSGRRTALIKHKYVPEAIAFTSDSRRIATLTHGFLRIADVQSGATLREFDLRDRPWRLYRHREYLAFLANDRQILLADMRTEEISLIDAENGKEIRKFVSKTKGVSAATLILGGQTLAMADEAGAIRLLDVATGAERLKLENALGNWEALTCSHDGKVLAAGTPGVTFLWDVATGRQTHKFVVQARLHAAKNTEKKEPQGRGLGSAPDSVVDFCAVDFSPDRKRLLTQDGLGISVWEIATGKETRRIEEKQREHARFMPNAHTIVQEGWDGFSFINTETGVPVPGNSLGGTVCAIGYSSDNKYLATSTRNVRVWDARRRQVIWHGPSLDERVHCLAFDANSTLLAAGSSKEIIVWNLATGAVRQIMRGDHIYLQAMSFNLEATQLTLGYHNGKSCVFTLSNGQSSREFDVKKLGPQHDLGVIAYSADLSLMARITQPDSINGETTLVVDIWDLEKGIRQRTFSTSGDVNDAQGLCFSPDARLLAIAVGSGRVICCEIASGQLRRDFLVEGASDRLAFSPDSRMLAKACAPDSSSILICDIRHAGNPTILNGHEGFVSSFCFSPDSRLLASGSSDETAFLWNVAETLRSNNRTAALTPSQRETCWNDLDQNAKTAFKAMEKLLDDPGAVDFLEAKLATENVGLDLVTVHALIADLDRNYFKTRSQAKERLAKFGAHIKGPLRHALSAKPSPETMRSLKELLQAAEGKGCRVERCVELLEWIATPAARQQLEKLANGPPEFLTTQEAKATLPRLARQIAQRESKP